ncbi:hypothetical protein [Blastococcus sp. SYSU DS0533]
MSRSNAPIYVRDYLPADWAGGDAAAEAAAFQAACDAAGDVAAGSKGCVVLPDATILLNAEVVTPWTGMTIMGGSEKSYIKLTTPDARLRINSFRVRLMNFRVNGQDLANNGIVFSNGARAKDYNVRVENCLADGWLVDPGSVPGGSCNLITLYGCESVSNNGNGFVVADSATATDATSFRLIECEGTSNGGHGALLRNSLPGIVGGSYMGNGGYGIQLGEAGDTLPTTGAQIRFPRIEGNTLGPFSEGVGTDAIIELNDSYSDATPGGSGGTNGTNGYTVNAAGRNYRVGYSGTTGGYVVRDSNGSYLMFRSADGSVRIAAPSGLQPSYRLGNAGIYVTASATPEGNTAAAEGSICVSRAAPYAAFRKVTGTGNTGWRRLGLDTVTRESGTSTTVTEADDVLLVYGTITVTLPSATAVPGRMFTVKNTSTGTITVATAGGNIDGAATLAMATRWESKTFIAHTGNWYVI